MPDAMRTMLPWLAAAARDARMRKGRLASHIAAEANMDQSAISRFEHAKGWPRAKDGRGPDQIINAYAGDLDCEPIDLWEDALRRWRTALDAGDATIPTGEEAAAEAFAATAGQATQPPPETAAPPVRPGRRADDRRKRP